MIPARSRSARATHPMVAAALLAALAGSLAPSLPAQPVIATPPQQPLLPPGERPLPTAASRPAIDPAAGSQLANAAPLAPKATPTTPFRYGPISVHPRVSESFLYSDGLPGRSGRKTNTYINTVSPGFRIDVGRNWTVDYGATWTYYTSRAFRESLDHSIRGAGTLTYRGWAAQFSQGYTTATAPLIETGRQTTTETVTTNLSLGKSFDRSWSVLSSAGQSLQFLGAAPDSYSWTTQHAVQYRYSSRLSVSGGVAAGYVDMDPGVNMAFVNPFAQVSWTPSEKLTFSAQGGEEIRQIFSRGVDAIYTPVFNVSVDYRPFQFTSVGASAGRTVAPSVLRNQINDSTNWSVFFSQRLLRHFTLRGNYGETDSGYSAVNERVTGGRRDRSYNYGVRLGTTFFRRGTVSGFYQGTHNSSNTPGLDLDSTQVGVEVSWTY